MLCSLVARLLLLKMLPPVELLFSVASTRILILLGLLNPDWEDKRELQVPHRKTVQQILLRLFLLLMLLAVFN